MVDFAMQIRRSARWLAALTAAGALLLALGPASASPRGEIVVRGAASGSHLELSLAGGNLVVHGWMARAAGAGCRLTHHRTLAVCRLRDAGGIEVDMGPSGDFVEVLDRLPVPLTVHLGDGSDKFIGNGERDTCYSEGARRNRCVGGPGDDVCVMGPGQDGCHGEAGKDELYGGPSADQLYGGGGYDRCDGTPGWGRSHECEAGPQR